MPCMAEPSANTIKYPDVTVELDDGNAFAIISQVRSELRRHDVGQEELDAFYKEATSGDYDHLLQTAIRWVSVV